MTNQEAYLFDLNGFLVVENIIPKDSLSKINLSISELEKAAEKSKSGKEISGHYGRKYFHNEKFNFKVSNFGQGGHGTIVEDFLEFTNTIDDTIVSEAIFDYLKEFIVGRIKITSLQVFFRKKGNFTPTHMGGPIDSRNSFYYRGNNVLDTENGDNRFRHFELNVVRVVIALHDIDESIGPLCLVPGSHKSNVHTAAKNNPQEEPFMMPVLMKAGDVLFFTENVRHGGMPITSDQTRKTIHITYQPSWTTSPSAFHWNKHLHVSQHVRDRFSSYDIF